MIFRLRVKLIATCMLSLMLVLAIIMGILNAVNYRGIIRDADSILDALKENAGASPLPEGAFDWPAPGPSYQSPELPFEIRFFSVLLAADDSILSFDTGQISAVDATSAAQYARQACASGAVRGFVEHYRFLRYEDASGIHLIFLDCGRMLSNLKNVLRNSILISGIGLLAVLLLIVILSGRIMKPFAENYEKQKRFITDAGHEIKTPITIIDAAAEVLELEYGENEWLQGIRQQAKRLGTLTSDLIRLSRLEECTALPVLQFPLSELTAESAGAFQPLARAQDKELILSVQPGIYWRGHAESMRQLISILLDNALKYSPARSCVYLRLERKSKGLCLQVSNESTQPLHRDQLENMFDRFYRGDPSRSKTSGYGIGLSIAQAIVRAHRGKIFAAAQDNTLTIMAQFPS